MFVTRTAYDALQRECDAWAERCERAIQRFSQEAENATIRGLRDALALEHERCDRIISANTFWETATAAAHENAGKAYGERDAVRAELLRERKLTRYLLKQVLTLRKEGFAQPRTEQQQHVSTPQSDVDLVYNTQRQLARDAAYQDLLAQGLSPDEARSEAARMIDSLFAPVAGEFQ